MVISSLLAFTSISILANFGCKGVSSNSFNSDTSSSLSSSILTAEQKDAKHVLVVINKNSEISEEIGSYYVKKRMIPHANVIMVSAPTSESTDGATFYASVIAPLQSFIRKDRNSIDYIVTTKGVPLLVNSFSGDAAIAAMDLLPPTSFAKNFQMSYHPNPYFNQDVPFSHKKFGIYLVDRLDGYTLDDIKALVDHSLEAKPEEGVFFFQGSPNRTTQTYGELQDTMSSAKEYLSAHNYHAYFTDQHHFVTTTDRCMGYVTWGSNHGFFDEKQYAGVKFYPGAISETYVSTSARTLDGNVPGQSEIGPLIHAGITGVKGYVSEPYTLALCRADILFERYVNGFNLAESFYAASPMIEWKDTVIGDPLCAPYIKG